MSFPELVGTDALTGLEEPGEREDVRKSELIGHLGDRGIGILQHALREFETLGVDRGLHGQSRGLTKLGGQMSAGHPDVLGRFLHGQCSIGVAPDEFLHPGKPCRPPRGSRHVRRKLTNQSVQQPAERAVRRLCRVRLQKCAAAGDPCPGEWSRFYQQGDSLDSRHLRFEFYRVVGLALTRITKAMPCSRREKDQRMFFHGDDAAFGKDFTFSQEDLELPELVLMKAENAWFAHRASLREKHFAGWVGNGRKRHNAKSLKTNCHGKTV
jgi:hypothetical protein